MLNLDSEDLLALFLNDENKKVLQEKVNEAINRIDVDELSNNLKEIILSVIEPEMIMDFLDLDQIGESATELILKSIKNQLG